MIPPNDAGYVEYTALRQEINTRLKIMTDSGRYCFVSVISMCAIFVALMSVDMVLGFYLMPFLMALPLFVILYCIVVFIENVVQIGFDASFLAVFYEIDISKQAKLLPPRRPCWETTLTKALRHNDICKNGLWQKRSHLCRPLYYSGVVLFVILFLSLIAITASIFSDAGFMSLDNIRVATNSDYSRFVYASLIIGAYCIVALYPAYQIIRRTPRRTFSMMFFEPYLMNTGMAVDYGFMTEHEREESLFDRGGMMVFLPCDNGPRWVQKSSVPKQNVRRIGPFQMFRGFRIKVPEHDVSKTYYTVFMNDRGRLCCSCQTIRSATIRIVAEGSPDDDLNELFFKNNTATCADYIQGKRY